MRRSFLVCAMLAIAACGSDPEPRPDPIDARVQPARDAVEAAERSAAERRREIEGVLSDTTQIRSRQ
jgi:hypothetical protein